MREIKFRAWDSNHKVMITPYCELRDGNFWGEDCTNTGISVNHENVMQFTGKKGYNDRELYEGDIIFYEEQTDEGDERFYLAIVWVSEWSMFASLFIDEYKNYVEHGADALDEVMFWTYTLEKSDYFHYAGNIYENPELLKTKE